MEVRDPIHGTIDLSPAEVSVVDSAPYQRLRAIKQLGFSEFSFPGATHNRFLHSIGVCHLSGIAFDSIFPSDHFSSSSVRARLRQAVRLAALLHDIGHGPLSHTTEEVMPLLRELSVEAYRYSSRTRAADVKANHEDYTIKFLMDSELTQILLREFADITPYHIACLVDRSLRESDDFFVDRGSNYRNILSQIVSSEMDVDRMDYLERDAYFCGTNYGKVELSWLLSNLSYHEVGGRMHLALSRRALYTFDDFLLARHHMHLMVYFHHKSIIYEELLYRYLTSEDCTFRLPADLEAYIHCTDYALYQHLAHEKNPWARRISERRPYRVVFELHSNQSDQRLEDMRLRLESEGVLVILANSLARLSKYHSLTAVEEVCPIFVVDEYDPASEAQRIEETTEIFKRYESIRRIDRIYVSPEDFDRAQLLIRKGL